MKISDSNEKFVPTPEWMAEKYNELNDWLFDGELGACEFNVTKLKAHMLAGFSMKRENLSAKRQSRQIYVKHGPYPDTWEYITKDNFPELCLPVISMSSQRMGTEKALLTSLVHEMCHYYTFRLGYLPKQAHGTEFRQIAAHVSYRSNGLFNIQRLATAEEMAERDFTDDLKKELEVKKEKKIQKLKAILGYINNGEIRLTLTSSEALIEKTISYYKTRNECYKVLLSDDTNLINFLYNQGYRTNLRALKYWNIEKKDFAKTIDKDYKWSIIFDKNTMQMNECYQLNENDLYEIVDKVLQEILFYEDNDIKISPDMNLGIEIPS